MRLAGGSPPEDENTTENVLLVSPGAIQTGEILSATADLLQRVPFLATLEPEDREALASTVTHRRFRRNDIIFQRGRWAAFTSSRAALCACIQSQE
jgi:hypothetical protein